MTNGKLGLPVLPKLGLYLCFDKTKVSMHRVFFFILKLMEWYRSTGVAENILLAGFEDPKLVAKVRFPKSVTKKPLPKYFLKSFQNTFHFIVLPFSNWDDQVLILVESMVRIISSLYTF